MDGDGPRQGNFAPVSLTNRRLPIERWAVIVAVVLGVVVAKPWPSPNDGGSADASGTPSRRSPQPSSAPTPMSPGDAARITVATFCLDTRTWLIASVERSFERASEQRIRVWRALEPATAASGPDDPAIPIVSIVSEGLTELGWCAPTVADASPRLPVDLDVWIRAPGGARPISLDSSRPVSDRSPYGALYRPPGKGPSSKATWWPDGTWVFRYGDAAGSQHWFAIEVETRPLPSPAD
jgi:hypothetical protein